MRFLYRVPIAVLAASVSRRLEGPSSIVGRFVGLPLLSVSGPIRLRTRLQIPAGVQAFIEASVANQWI